MAWESPGFKLTGLVSDADNTGSQYLAVVADTTAGQCTLAGAGVEILGVLQNAPAAAEAAEIMMNGVTKGISGAAITVGSKVEVDAAGKFITQSAGVTVGFALLAAGGADEIITVALV